MRNRAHRVFAITLAFALAGTAGALASGPVNGKTYEGSAPSSGISSEGHRLRTYAIGKVLLRVAANGRSVTVRFSSSSPLLYCRTQEQLHVQSTRAASISRSGTFKATVGERFAAGPGPPAIVQVVAGQFSGHTMRGTIHTQAAECGGVATFSATSH